MQQVLRTLVPLQREVSIQDGLTYQMQIRPYRDLNNVIDGVVITYVDVSERKKTEQVRALLAAIVESSQDAIISHDLDGTITSWNSGAEQLYGCAASEALGKSLSAVIGETLPTNWSDLRMMLASDKTLAHFDSTRAGKDGQPIEISVTISPVKGSSGVIVGASFVARDISERKAAERKSALLLGELDHRVKNILAIVSAVVSQTLKTTPDPKAFAADVGSRVEAIARAHSLLTQSGQGDVSLRAIVETELAPYNHSDDKVVIMGPEIVLTPRAALSLAMAIHELASNAAKYGALSRDAGRLTVRWQTAAEKDPVLTLSWTEADGPVVKPPSRRGFGTTLIERALAHELDAKVGRTFSEAGVHCTISIPLTEAVGRADAP